MRSTINDANLIDRSGLRSPGRSRARGSLLGRWGIWAMTAACLTRGN